MDRLLKNNFGDMGYIIVYSWFEKVIRKMTLFVNYGMIL